MVCAETFTACDTAHDDLLSTSSSHVLVDVSIEGCPPCRQIAALLPALVRRFDGAVHILQVDAEVAPEFITRWAVRAFPSLLLFRNGELLDRQFGFTGYMPLVRWLDERTAHSRDEDLRSASAVWEQMFKRHAVQAEADYEAATRPPAEVLGRVLGPAFEAHEALVTRLEAESTTGNMAAEDAVRARQQSHEALLALGAPERAAQRQITTAALERYVQDIKLATLAYRLRS